MKSKRNFMAVSHSMMYNFALAPYSRKSKYRSYRAPLEYSLAFKMETKAKSTRTADKNTFTLLGIAQILKKKLENFT